MSDEDLPELVSEKEMDQDFDSEDNDTDEEMSDDSDELTKCLFCQNYSNNVEKAIKHIQSEHNLSFQELKLKFHMDQYSFIKLINCIRLENVTVEVIQKAEEAFWSDDKYLKPKDYEPWLCYDYEELIVNDNKEEKKEDTELLVAELKSKVNIQADLLKQAAEDITKMRESFKRLLDRDLKDPKKVNSVAEKSLQSDEGYFSSYAHFGIHHEMLSDVVRTTSYKDALLKNVDFVKGKIVLDVGCGTGVLSIFASQAGAKTVVGIDNSDIIYNAMDIVKNNNVENVQLVKGRLEDTELPEKKFDIIVSEWMGYFLLFEGMLDTVIFARDVHLKEDGILMPNRCTMHLMGYGNKPLFEKHVTFWNDVYGLNMSNMTKHVLQEPLVEVVEPDHILTESEVIADLDLMKVDLNYSNFTYNFNLKCLKDGSLTSFVGYFNTYFDLPTPVMFGTSPNDPPTHWKQVVFFLEKPVEVKTEEIVKGTLTCRRLKDDIRSIEVIISAFGKKTKYFID